MQTQAILNQPGTKTEKIQKLLALGLSRKEVATLMGVGYGFVQNVFAATYPDRVRSRRVIDAVIAEFNFRFTRTFGVELELFGIERSRLVAGLREAGIEVQDEYYNHTTRAYWKIVGDGSVRGDHALELVSPVLKGDEGMAELKKVCEVLKALNGRINATCGTHYGKRAVMLSGPLRWLKRQAPHLGALSIISVVTRRDTQVAPRLITYEKERKSYRNHQVGGCFLGRGPPVRV